MARPDARRALLSVSDKTGIVELAGALRELGFELISTGGTARAIAAAGLPVTAVEELTGFPEIMDGRVKTLHPKVHGALLGRTAIDDAVMREHGIAAIDVVVINLYPFAETIAKPGCSGRRRDREHRRRRPSHAACRRQESRARDRARRSVGLRPGARRAAHWQGRRDRRDGVSPQGPSGTPRGMTESFPAGCGGGRAIRPSRMLSLRHSARSRISATARIRTNRPRSMLTRSRQALPSRQPGSCRARNFPTTTLRMQTPRSSACGSSIRRPA